MPTPQETLEYLLKQLITKTPESQPQGQTVSSPWPGDAPLPPPINPTPIGQRIDDFAQRIDDNFNNLLGIPPYAPNQYTSRPSEPQIGPQQLGPNIGPRKPFTDDFSKAMETINRLMGHLGDLAPAAGGIGTGMAMGRDMLAKNAYRYLKEVNMGKDPLTERRHNTFVNQEMDKWKAKQRNSTGQFDEPRISQMTSEEMFSAYAKGGAKERDARARQITDNTIGFLPTTMNKEFRDQFFKATETWTNKFTDAGHIYEAAENIVRGRSPIQGNKLSKMPMRRMGDAIDAAEVFVTTLPNMPEYQAPLF